MIRLLALLLLAIVPLPLDAETESKRTEGRFLVATPDLIDPNFHHTVVLMLQHDEYGALGLVINRQIGLVPVHALIESMGKETNETGAEIAVFIGGPVQSDAGFILHTPDVMMDSSRLVAAEIAVTADPAMLEHVADGSGPEIAIASFGYAGWAPGQLESEIARGSWVVTEADRDILFDLPVSERWATAYQRYGIEL